MTALSKTLREDIVTAALNKAFSARTKSNDAELVKLTDELYKLTFGKFEPIARKLPQGWACFDHILNIKHAGFDHMGKTNPNPARMMGKSRPVPYRQNTSPIVVTTGHALYEAFDKAAHEWSAIRADKEALRVRLNSIVNAANTIKQLEAVWPEGIRFVPPAALKPKQRALVPISLVEEVNEQLGLGLPDAVR